MHIRKLDPAMLFPAAVPGLILVTAWLEIFMKNSGSFTLDTAEAFLLAGAAWVTSSLLLFFLFYAVSFFPWHKWITAGVLGLSCSMILQYHLGNEFFEAAVYFDEITFDTLLLSSCHTLMLALPAAAALWQKERCYKWRIRLSMVLILMQAVTLIHSACTAPKFSDNYDFKEYSFSEKEKFSFGKKENIIVLVVDCMGERILKDVLTRYPELQQTFKDFTCFDRMVSPLPRTMYAVPALLTGIDFPGAEKGEPEDDDHGIFLNRVCRDKNSLLQLARKNGFRVEGYPFILQTISYAPEVIDNSETITHEVRKYSVLKILEVMLNRLVPAFLKSLIFDEAEAEMIPFVQQGAADGRKGLLYDQNFYKRLTEEFTVSSREKVFKYLHIHGAHEPVAADENLVSKPNVFRHQQLRGSLKIVELLLRKLKMHGIYDSSTIVITGDHTERYTPEIATFVKRPFEQKNTLIFNSVPCRISQISGSVAKIAGLDPDASSIFDPALIPGNINDVRNKERQYPRFTNWKKMEKRKKLHPDGSVQGNHILHGNRIMIELAGGNSLQTAAQVCVTAENVLTAEQYETALIKEGNFQDILLPELNLPDGDYLLTVTETGLPAGMDRTAISRVIPAWLRIRGTRLSFSSRTADLFHKSIIIDEEMIFHPFACWPGLRFSSGCTAQWGYMLIPEKEKLQLRLPDPSGSYRAEIMVLPPPAFRDGYIAAVVNGREKNTLTVPSRRQHLLSVDVVPDKEGMAEISLEYRSAKKDRRRNKSNYSNRSLIFSITVRKKGSAARQTQMNSGS